MIAAAPLVLVGCGSGGDLSIVNNSSGHVAVDLGDERVEDVGPDGGAVVLDYGCTPGDVTVERESGDAVSIDGPVCPETEIVVEDDRVRLRAIE